MSINSIDVVTAFPKAHAKLIDPNRVDGVFHYDRGLFDLFDSVGIIVAVDYETAGSSFKANEFSFGYRIHVKESDEVGFHYSDDGFLHRQQAETAAFMEAFKVLEELLG